MTLTVNEVIIENEDPYVGDRARYSGNRAITVFSSADFTTDTILPFNDPEGDLLAAIRIEEVSEANTGQYLFYGSPVVVGQEITAAELDSGVFYHEGPDSNSVTTDSIRVSLKTENNPNWVQ